MGIIIEGNVYQIENSELHKSMGGRIRSVEFLYLKKDNQLLFIEAKSSTPRKGTNLNRYGEFLDEIVEKFIHSFEMVLSYHLKRTLDDKSVGENIKKLDFHEVGFSFILVVSGHQESWCLPLQEELKIRMLYHTKIWKSNIIVINDAIARKKYHLIK